LPVQAEQLIAAAERAPYGRGEETLTDPKVRRTWQIAPDRVRLGGRHWPKTFNTIVARVAEGLGVTHKVEAQLYKLLIYDQGGFFVPHRDTEKAKGMFATLIVVVPSLSAGGELMVRHKEREARLDLRCEEPSDVAFAAFYVGQAILSGSTPTAALSDPGVTRAVVGGGLYLTVLGLLALGLATIIRHTAGAIFTFVSVLLILPLIVSAFPARIGHPIGRYLPAVIGSAMTSTTGRGHPDFLPSFPPWTGFGILCAYAAGALLVGGLLMVRRDP